MVIQESPALPVVVSAPAEIDASNAAQLGAALLAANGSCPAVVVDMSQTVFCDSAGIGALVQAHTRAVAGGGELRVVITSAPVLRIFALIGVDQLLPTFTTLPGALAGVSVMQVPAGGSDSHDRRRPVLRSS